MSNETKKDGERAAFEDRIAELERDRNSWRALAESAKRDLSARAASQATVKSEYERGWDDGHIAGREKARAAAPQLGAALYNPQTGGAATSAAAANAAVLKAGATLTDEQRALIERAANICQTADYHDTAKQLRALLAAAQDGAQ